MSKPLTIVRGSDVTIPFTLTGVNLTGMTVFFTVKDPSLVDSADSADANALIKYSTTSHTDPVNGVTSVVLSGAASTGSNTSNVVPGTYDYDVWTKDGSGTMLCRTAGVQKLQIVSAVTQRRA